MIAKIYLPHLLRASAAALCAFTIFPSHVQADPPQFTVTILGSVADSANVANAINDSGQLAGTAGGEGDAVVWTGTTPAVLSSPGGTTGSYANAINDAGEVAGYSFLPLVNGMEPPGTVPVVWNGTTPTLLNSFGGTYSAANGINDSGQVVGYSILNINSGASDALVWSGTTPTVLGSLGGDASDARAINASGQIAGDSDFSGDTSGAAVVWTGTTPTALGSLTPDAYSAASAINDLGEAAGASDTAGGGSDAVVWSGTTPTDIGILLNSEDSEATSINDSGEVVGLFGPSGEGFLYSGGVMYNLASLLPSEYSNDGIIGFSINNLGQIAASGDINGQDDALLLTPTTAVPEPATGMLALVAGVLLLLRRPWAVIRGF